MMTENKSTYNLQKRLTSILVTIAILLTLVSSGMLATITNAEEAPLLDEDETPIVEDYTPVGGPEIDSGCAIVDGVLIEYIWDDEHVVVPDYVTAIDDGVFQGNEKLVSIELPSGLKKIGSNAFKGCKNLVSADISDSVTEIGDGAFEGCTSLSGSLVLPQSLSYLGMRAFYDCYSLTGTLVIPESVDCIDTATFYNCLGLNGTLIIPNGVKVVGPYAFSGCDFETIIVNGPTSLYCNSFTRQFFEQLIKTISFNSRTPPDIIYQLEIFFESFYQKQSVRTSDRLASDKGVKEFFDRLYGLETIVFPEQAYGSYMTAYGSYIPETAAIQLGNDSEFVVSQDGVLIRYQGNSENVVIPDGIKEIGAGAFQNNKTVVNVEWPSTVQSVGVGAFRNCAQLKSVGPTENLLVIGNHAFDQCRNLESFVFGKNLKEIGAYAFHSCASLSSELYLAEDLTLLGEHAFHGCKSLQGSIAIPEEITKVGDYTFYDCNGLTGDLIVDGSVTEIGNYAFAYCENINGQIVLDDEIVTIGDNAFYACKNLSGSLVLPEKLEILAGNAFGACNNLSGTLLIPVTVKEIGNYSFYDCSFSSVIFEGNPETAYLHSFNGCDDITSLVFNNLPSSLVLSNVLYPLKSIKRIYVPEVYIPEMKRLLAEIDEKYSSLDVLASYYQNPISDLQVSKVYSKSVCLVWLKNASSSIDEYRIKRRAMTESSYSIIGETAHCEWTDTVPETGKEYEYAICGLLDDGSETEALTVRAFPNPPVIQKINGGVSASEISIGKSSLTAYVENSGNYHSLHGSVNLGSFSFQDENGHVTTIKEGIKGSRYSDGTVRYTVDHWDISQILKGTYSVTFEITDVDGTSSKMTVPMYFNTTRPSKIESVIAVGDTNKIAVSWSKAKEQNVKAYELWRTDESHATSGYNGGPYWSRIAYIENRDTVSYEDTSVGGTQKYSYYVIAVNDVGNKSEQSDEAVAYPKKDEEAPRCVKFTPAPTSRINKNAEIYAQFDDNVSVTVSYIYYSLDNENWTRLAWSGNQADRVNATFDTTAFEDQIVYFKATARDAAGNLGESSVYHYKIDNAGPEQVVGLSAETTATSAVIKWADVTDKDFAHFCLEQEQPDGTFKTVQKITQTLGAQVLNLRPKTTYRYRVVAYDDLGNRGTESETIEVVTMSDTTSPVVTAISPAASYYRDAIDLKFSIEDDDSVDSIVLQTSNNTVQWADQATINANPKGKRVVFSYHLDLTSFEEGALYVRAIPKDEADNIGDSSAAAPFVQYIVDRTAPATPEGFVANITDGRVQLSWKMGAESDLNGYSVFRSEDGTNYKQVASNLKKINYWDTTVDLGKTYYYKLEAADVAGNISGETDTVSTSLPDDSQAPEIVSVAPTEKQKIGPSTNLFSVMVRDNWKVASVLVTYQVNNEVATHVLIDEGSVDNYYTVLKKQLPLDNLKHGDKVEFCVLVKDKMGLESKEKYSYEIDKEAPQISQMVVSSDSSKMYVSWTGLKEADLAGYRVYRKADSGEFKLIGQRAVTDNASYVYTDSNAERRHDYWYKVEAVDENGNVSEIISEKARLNSEAEVSPELQCDLEQEVNTEYVFDASLSYADDGIASYTIDYGDGTSIEQDTPVFKHKYATTGSFGAILTIKDKNGKIASAEKKISVTEPQLLGTLKVRVVDADGHAISGAKVNFDYDNTSSNVKTTGTDGVAEFVAKTNEYAIGAYATDYLPLKKSVIIRAGSVTELKMVLVKQQLVTGEFEVQRMTLNEIEAAGIDISDPANQQTVKINIHMEYGTTPLNMTLYSNGGSVHVNNTKIVDTNEGQRKVTATVVRLDPAQPESCVVAIMDVPVKASFLKEFFDVKLHLLNHASSEFHIKDNSVKLNIPEGMSLADAPANYSEVSFDTFYGQEQKTIEWFLRGDTEGEYNLSADYVGTLDGFDSIVHATFKTSDPIKVYGLSAVKLVAEVNASLHYGALYFNVGLENVSGIDVNLPQTSIVNNAIMSYEKKLNEEGNDNWTETKRTVQQLGQYFKTAEGYKSYLATYDKVNTLAPGESLLNRYVSYDAVKEYDHLYLQQAFAEMAEAYDIEVEIRKYDFDLYSIESAADKMTRMLTEAQVYNAFDFIRNNSNYQYWLTAASLDTAWNALKELGYRSAATVLAGDTTLFTNENEADITRSAIYEMLLDESYQSACDFEIDNECLGVTKKILSGLADVFEDTGDADTYEALRKMASSSKELGKLAATWQGEGTDSLIDEIAFVGAELAGAKVRTAIQAYYNQNRDKVSVILGDALATSCKKISSVIGKIDRVIDDWNDANTLAMQMVVINANRVVAEQIFDTVLAESAISKTKAYSEVKKMKAELEKGATTQVDYFANELMKHAGEVALNYGVKKVTELVAATFFGPVGIAVEVIKQLIKFAWGVIDEKWHLKDRFNDRDKLMIYSYLTLPFYNAVNDSANLTRENAGPALINLKFLTKLRILGEEVFVEVATNEKYQKERDIEESLNKINEEQHSTFESIQSYYNVTKVRLLQARDCIFNTGFFELNREEAPEVSINYFEETTNDTYAPSYEYSYDGDNWINAKGKKIPLYPGTVGSSLWLRKASSSSNPAGNVAKIIVPGRPYIRDDSKVWYSDGRYYFSGLSEGSYRLRNAGGGTFYVNSYGNGSVEGTKTHTIKIQKNASGRSFASEIFEKHVEEYGEGEEPLSTIINISNDVLTVKQSHTLQSAPRGGNSTYQYSYKVIDPDGNITVLSEYSSSPVATFEPVAVGNYTVMAGVKDDLGREFWDSKEVFVSPENSLSISSAALSLGNSFAINFKVYKKAVEGYDNLRLHVERNGKEYSISAAKEEEDSFIFTFSNMAPQTMNDLLTAKLYADIEGQTFASKPVKLSVKNYVTRVLEKYSADEYEKLRTLMVDILNYGAAAQEYQKYKIDNLVNADLTDEQKAWGTIGEIDLQNITNVAYKTIENPEITWKSAALVLDSAVTVRYKFAAEDIEGLAIKVKYGKTEKEYDEEAFVNNNDGTYSFDYSGLYAHQMSEPLYVTIYKGSKPVSNTLQYSVESYAALVKARMPNTLLEKMTSSMMKYGLSASNYKG